MQTFILQADPYYLIQVWKTSTGRYPHFLYERSKCVSVFYKRVCDGRKHWFPLTGLLPGWAGMDVTSLSWLFQSGTAHRPVMQVVKRSPQDTDLMVTPDWPSRKREMNWGCICSTTPGRLASPEPTDGACGNKWLLVLMGDKAVKM